MPVPSLPVSMRRTCQRPAWRAALALAALPALLLARPAVAQPAGPTVVVDDPTRATTKRLGEEGTRAYLAGDYALASEKLERAYTLMPVPSLGLWSARAFVKRGLWLRAAERYRAVAGLDAGPGNPAVQGEARVAAAREEAELTPRIPSLRVLLTGAATERASVSIDGVPVPQARRSERWPVDPGGHVLTAERDGERVSASATVSEGEHAEVTLRLSAEALPAAAPVLPPVAPAPAPPVAAVAAPAGPELGVAGNDASSWRTAASPWRAVGWVTLGVGGATLLGSGVAGLWARELRRDLDCQGQLCTDASGASDYNALVDVATAGWIAGAALAATGVSLVLLLEEEADATLSVQLRPGQVSLGGRF